MAKIKVVTACVDMGLSLRHFGQTQMLGRDLMGACQGRGVEYYGALNQIWSVQEFPGLRAANARALDRFATVEEHERSNYVQHMPVQWLEEAYSQFPGIDVFIWLGYTILKQGGFTGKKTTSQHITDFVDRLERWTPDYIPFPGITPLAPISVHGDNWRFCGSTIIAPARFLPAMVRSYKANLRHFVRQHTCMPLDLAIWPMVEFNSGLPFRFYQAEYDYTQLTNFPG